MTRQAESKNAIHAKGGRIFFIWITAFYPAIDHAVTDEEMAERRKANRGEDRALCGAVFLPAPDRPEGARCPGCVGRLQVRQQHSTAEQRLTGSDGRGRHAARTGRSGR